MNKEETKRYNKHYRLTHNDKRQGKMVVLLSGNEEGAGWAIRITVTPRSKIFNGYFQFKDRPKVVVLAGGREEGSQWSIRMEITARIKISYPIFNFIEQFKTRIRDKDRHWARYHIPMSKNMEVHHDWKEGGRPYLLTCAEHRALHKMEVI